MTDSYTVRKGTGHGRVPKDYHDLISRYRSAEDDGSCAWLPPGTVKAHCLDCGGDLVGAEAGFVPYHRVCMSCGSHWSLTPEGDHVELRRARFY